MFDIDSLYDNLPKREKKGKSLITLPSDYVVFDITTDGTSSYDPLLEIAAYKVVNDEIKYRYHDLVHFNIDWILEPDTLEKTGLTNEVLHTKGIDLEQVLDNFVSFIGENVLITHYNAFVINYTYDILENFGYDFRNDFVDTMRLAKKVYPNLDSYSQDYLLGFLSLKPRVYKRALSDIDNIFEIYNFLKSKIIKENIDIKYHQLDPYKVSIPDEEIIDNPLIKNKHFAFTGALEKMERKDACELVVKNSGIVDSSIIKKTNYLVLGELDYSKTKNGDKSTKILKAEKLISDGQDLVIIDENHFYEMVRGGNDG